MVLKTHNFKVKTQTQIGRKYMQNNYLTKQHMPRIYRVLTTP